MSTRHWSRIALVGGALLGLFAIPWTSAVGAREEPSHLPSMYECAQSFAEALSRGNANELTSVAHSSLLGRVSVQPEPAKRRTYECVDVGPVKRTKSRAVYGTARLLARQPDGVEDLVTVTLKLDGGQWRVVGGPVGHTRPNPLDD